MNTSVLLPAKCVKCHGHHGTIQAYKNCQRGDTQQCMSITPHGSHQNPVTGLTCTGYTPPVAPVMSEPDAGWRSKWVTKPQRELVKKLGGDVGRTFRAGQTRGTVSDYINELKAGTATVTDPMKAPNRTKTSIPMDFLMAVPDGYYASRPDSDHEYTFFRVSHPKSGQFKDAMKIQTQHGPDLHLFMVIWPSGSLTVYDKRWEDDFLLVTVDTNGCALAYARKLKHCCRCNTELTDPRSRWYGIGPDCEKKYDGETLIRIVDETRGPWKPGMDVD